MRKCYWIIGQMCVGKSYYSHILGKMMGLKPIHLDDLPSMPLLDAYKTLIQDDTVLIEGFTPHRNKDHLEAITEALKDYEINYIQIAPPYKKWIENCKPVISCATDENPPSYTRQEYEAENKRLSKLKPLFIIS